jgi:hypothetical protein
MSRHRFAKKLCAGATLALAAVVLVPTAQAGASINAGTQVNDADAIHARWHNVGYELRHRQALPLGFARHKGSASTVTHSTTRTAAVANTEPSSSSSFDWAKTAFVSALVASLGLVLVLGGTLVRRRPATS